MSSLRTGRVLWGAAFIAWALLYLLVATEIGVFALYGVIEFPGDLHSWKLLTAWMVGAAAGGWVLVTLMKRAFDERGAAGGEFDAQD